MAKAKRRIVLLEDVTTVHASRYLFRPVMHEATCCRLYPHDGEWSQAHDNNQVNCIVCLTKLEEPAWYDEQTTRS
jgi:hypothetical protein